MWKGIVVICFWTLWAASPAFALTQQAGSSSPATTGDVKATEPSDDELTTQLEAIEAQTREIQDLTADFQQHKYTTLLKKPLVSSGTLRIKGSAMRWDARKPQPNVIAIDESSIQMYYPRQKALEIYPIERRLSQLAASPIFRLDAMRDHFAIERSEWTDETVDVPEEHLTIRLLPTRLELREHLESVTILFNLESGQVAAAAIAYPDQDRLVLIFANVHINTGLSDEDVALVVPEGTTITRPLELDGANGDEQATPSASQTTAENAR